MKFEELLSKYGITAEEVTFEVEGLSDEELEAKFVEMFDSDDNTDGTSTSEGEGDNGDVEGDDAGSDDGNDDGDGDGDNNDDGDVEKFTKIFTVELSHDDIRYALYNLISQYDEEDDEYYGIRSVYDNYFIMYGWRNNKLYKVGYSVDGENVSLEGERQEVFELIVTESEKIAIEKMRENYDSLVKYKEDTEAAALQAQKDAIFADEKYNDVVNTKAFQKLISNSKDYSVEECAQKADDILDDFSSFAVNFAATDKIKKPGTLGLNFNAEPSKKNSAYGGLFEKDE